MIEDGPKEVERLARKMAKDLSSTVLNTDNSAFEKVITDTSNNPITIRIVLPWAGSESPSPYSDPRHVLTPFLSSISCIQSFTRKHHPIVTRSRDSPPDLAVAADAEARLCSHMLWLATYATTRSFSLQCSNPCTGISRHQTARYETHHRSSLPSTERLLRRITDLSKISVRSLRAVPSCQVKLVLRG